MSFSLFHNIILLYQLHMSNNNQITFNEKKLFVFKLNLLDNLTLFLDFLNHSCKRVNCCCLIFFYNFISSNLCWYHFNLFFALLFFDWLLFNPLVHHIYPVHLNHHIDSSGHYKENGYPVPIYYTMRFYFFVFFGVYTQWNQKRPYWWALW